MIDSIRNNNLNLYLKVTTDLAACILTVFVIVYICNDAQKRIHRLIETTEQRHKRALCSYIQNPNLYFNYTCLINSVQKHYFASLALLLPLGSFFFYGNHIRSWPRPRPSATCHYSRKAGNCGRSDKPFLSAASRFVKANS